MSAGSTASLSQHDHSDIKYIKTKPLFQRTMSSTPKGCISNCLSCCHSSSPSYGQAQVSFSTLLFLHLSQVTHDTLPLVDFSKGSPSTSPCPVKERAIATVEYFKNWHLEVFLRSPLLGFQLELTYQHLKNPSIKDIPLSTSQYKNLVRAILDNPYIPGPEVDSIKVLLNPFLSFLSPLRPCPNISRQKRLSLRVPLARPCSTPTTMPRPTTSRISSTLPSPFLWR